jgi:hypothetical protein
MREGVGVFIGHSKRAAWCARQGLLQPISDSRHGGNDERGSGPSVANTELG